MELSTPAAPPQPARAVGEITKVPSIHGALLAWLFTVVLLSALALAGPLFVPLAHTGRVDTSISFGKGELLGFALALFAAAVSRWIVHGARASVALLSLSIAGLALVAIAIALVWFDSYQVQTGQATELFLPVSSVVFASWILVGLAFFCGAASEIAYAYSLRPTAVK